ncbi:MAG: VOC family protein [Pseudomonadota bacterium]
MLDHLSVGADNVEAAAKFYTPVLAKIGCECMAANDDLAAYGRGRVEFAVMRPFDKNPATTGNGIHVAFHARTNEEVDAFYATALENGGTCAGEPGPRAYPHAEVYAAFVRDPLGNKLEVLAGGFAA